MYKYLFPAIIIFCFACNDAGKNVYVPDLPQLKADTVNQFRLGDRFILATSTNSCCMYCWEKRGRLEEEIPSSTLLKLVEIVEDPSDPDCAGCSSFYYSIYECIAPGSDTLRSVVIPMGDVGNASGCKEVERQRVDSSAFRNYSLKVIQ